MHLFVEKFSSITFNMSAQLSMNDSHITATASKKWEIQSLGNAFDWNDFSDVESVDLDEFASDDEEK